MYNFEDSPTIQQLTNDYKDAVGIFPALHKYKNEHNIANLQKLCVEVADFCRAIYSSTKSDEERKVYKNMLEKLNK